MTVDILLKGLLIFVARVCDVSLGTMRTIATVQGRTKLAFIVGFIELNIWVMVISTVITNLHASYFLGFFYALGFATGNVLGIIIERKLAIGAVVLRVFTLGDGKKMAERLREHGQGVTTFAGKGMKGEVTGLYVACRRRDVEWIIKIIKEEDKDAFYIMEHAREIGRMLHPTYQQPTGWRSVPKKK